MTNIGYSMSGITSASRRKMGPREVKLLVYRFLPIATALILGIFLTVSVIYSVVDHEPTPSGAVIASVVFSALVGMAYVTGVIYMYYKRKEQELEGVFIEASFGEYRASTE